MNSAAITNFIDEVSKKVVKDHPDWMKVFNKTYMNTLDTAIEQDEKGNYFILTGDIPAMWQRDSTCQVRPYLVLANKIPEISDLIFGVVKRQIFNMNLDPYANAFNQFASGKGHQSDKTEMTPWVWERKFEIDSLCFPVQLAYLLYKNSGRTDQFDDEFESAIEKLLTVFETEQHHENSDYTFERFIDRSEDTLVNSGKGSPVGYTGMIWSAFRPSDDACVYGYLIPANMFATLALKYIEDIFTNIKNNSAIVARAKKIRLEVTAGIEKYGITTNKDGNKIYAYETDGLGNFLIMDDGNVPSLLSAPYLKYKKNNDSIYAETRKTILSVENPYYFAGKYAKGIGSPHTPKNYIWHIALAIQGLTSDSEADKKEILQKMVDTTAGTNLMHEGFDVDNPNNYTREWFSWANMMFCELLLNYYQYEIKE